MPLEKQYTHPFSRPHGYQDDMTWSDQCVPFMFLIEKNELVIKRGNEEK